MKKIKIILILSLSFHYCIIAQTKLNPSDFNGAPATLKNYKALYFLDESDEKKMKSILRNINNALEDPRLKGKLEVELVAFGEGIELFKKTNHYDTTLLRLQDKGLIFAQCLNTMRSHNVSKDELWPFISYVPTGNGEIIIRQSEGWSVIHP
jgi:intracellular sulfur oxidation DsrE/DsrF family protein